MLRIAAVTGSAAPDLFSGSPYAFQKRTPHVKGACAATSKPAIMYLGNIAAGASGTRVTLNNGVV